MIVLMMRKRRDVWAEDGFGAVPGDHSDHADVRVSEDGGNDDGDDNDGDFREEEDAEKEYERRALLTTRTTTTKRNESQ